MENNMNKYLKRSLKRTLNRRANRLIQQQVDYGIDSLMAGVLGTSHPKRRTRVIQTTNTPSAPPIPPPSPKNQAQIEHYVQMGDDDLMDFDEWGKHDGYDETVSGHNTCSSHSQKTSTLTQREMATTPKTNFDHFNVSHRYQSGNNKTFCQSSEAVMNEHSYTNFTNNPTKNAHACYELINNKANSNAFIQGASGFFGFVATMAVDVGAIPLIYATMWNEIRAIYGQEAIDTDDALKVIANILPEVLNDAIFDKVLGNVPVIGVYFNAICAKQMTWRLGTLFTLLASRGGEVHTVKCKEAMMMIRHMFPQSDMFRFATPDYQTFIQLAESVQGSSADTFNHKVESALNVFLTA